jgi:predicted phosphoserine aminotransferase
MPSSATTADSMALPQWTGRFFLPGPTEVRPDVLMAQTRPMIGHRGKAMEELMERLQPGLRAVFRTSRPVYIGTNSATGFMEAALRNGARRRVLSLVNGAFSERFFQIAVACGFDVTPLRVANGEAHAPDRVADALRETGADAITVVHSETSTGAMNPVADIARVAHEAGVRVLVDSVSGMGGVAVETDAWELEFVLTGSQKALALPPGLAFGVASERLLKTAADNDTRGIYFDLLEFDRYAKKHQTPSTPALSLLYATEQQLGHIMVEGMDARWARHEAMARRMWAWVDEQRDRGAGVGILAPEGARSHTVTCLTMPEGTKGSDVAAAMKTKGFTIATGYGALKDDMVRIGHMGEHTVDELDAVLYALAEVLAP